MDNNDYIFTIIGKLYTDLHNAQRIIDALQGKLKDKDQEIQDLKRNLK